MKYSSVILNLTIMLSSVESLRHLPFIVIRDENTDKHFYILPMDGWQDPFIAITGEVFESLCDQAPTAQKIKFYSDSDITSSTSTPTHQFVQLYLKNIEKVNSLELRITNSEQETTAYGRACEYQVERIFFMKNSNYEGYLLFKLIHDENKQQYKILFMGYITNHLSYEDTGKAAIGLFENARMKSYINELQAIKICASLFQSLSSTLVQRHAPYYIRRKIRIKTRKKYLNCKGDLRNRENYATFIKYKITIQEFGNTINLRVTHIKGSAIFTDTITIFNA